jgi:hypothetical protein
VRTKFLSVALASGLENEASLPPRWEGLEEANGGAGAELEDGLGDQHTALMILTFVLVLVLLAIGVGAARWPSPSQNTNANEPDVFAEDADLDPESDTGEPEGFN